MLRALLLYLSQAVWARKLVTGWGLAWRVASRFVAGETLDDAVGTVKELNGRGYFATLDHLGEYTTNESEAIHSTEEVLEILDRIDSEALQSGISIKLSQIGLAIDQALCEKNLIKIMESAAEKNIFLRIDMEDSRFVSQTLQLFEKLESALGAERIGIVIQSYLYRSAADVAALAERGSRVRLVKGAYKEPAEVAFPEKKDVDEEFDSLADTLLDASLKAEQAGILQDGRVPPILAVASHDDRRVAHAIQTADAKGVPKNLLEFQMLYGIRRDLQEDLKNKGYPVRIYVPFGSQWYPYFVRRLAERPANLWFFISNFFRK